MMKSPRKARAKARARESIRRIREVNRPKGIRLKVFRQKEIRQKLTDFSLFNLSGFFVIELLEFQVYLFCKRSGMRLLQDA